MAVHVFPPISVPTRVIAQGRAWARPDRPGGHEHGRGTGETAGHGRHRVRQRADEEQPPGNDQLGRRQ
jgi:hypothetical protein